MLMSPWIGGGSRRPSGRRGTGGHTPPSAVLVDTDPGVPRCGSQLDFVAYFKRHPLFAEIWSRYKLTADWGRYRLYTPKD